MQTARGLCFVILVAPAPAAGGLSDAARCRGCVVEQLVRQVAGHVVREVRESVCLRTVPAAIPGQLAHKRPLAYTRGARTAACVGGECVSMSDWQVVAPATVAQAGFQRFAAQLEEARQFVRVELIRAIADVRLVVIASARAVVAAERVLRVAEGSWCWSRGKWLVHDDVDLGSGDETTVVRGLIEMNGTRSSIW
jgi:hypothetical protein